MYVLGHALREDIMIHRGSDRVRSAFYLICTSLPEVGIYARISSNFLTVIPSNKVPPNKVWKLLNNPR
jgi:hypothetical protein